jgi:hypothetical protein
MQQIADVVVVSLVRENSLATRKQMVAALETLGVRAATDESKARFRLMDAIAFADVHGCSHIVVLAHDGNALLEQGWDNGQVFNRLSLSTCNAETIAKRINMYKSFTLVIDR